MKRLVFLVCLILVGCGKSEEFGGVHTKVVKGPGKIVNCKFRCTCGRLVYDGPGELVPGCPAPWPLGKLDYCDPKECEQRKLEKGLREREERQNANKIN